MKQSSTKMRRRMFYLLAPLISVSVTLVALELLLRGLAPVSVRGPDNIRFEPDPLTWFRLQPNSISFSNDGIPIKTNRHGFRGRDFNFEKKEATFRIMVIGDSFTFGYNVPEENVYPAVLQRMLREKVGEQIEVINAGVGAWQPFQYAQFYEHYGRQFKPDLIVVGFFVGNDTYDQMMKIDGPANVVLGRLVSKKTFLIGTKVFLYDKFHLARLVINKTERRTSKTFFRKHCEDFTEEYLYAQYPRRNNHLKLNPEQRKKARNSVYQIQRIQELADADSIPMLVALIPDENQLNPALQEIIYQDEKLEEYDFNMPQAMLKMMFENRKIKVLDLLPAFRRDSRCLYMNDTHWNIDGHQLAATLLLPEISNYIKGNTPEEF